MVDDDLLMQQVQDVLSRYPLQPVGGNLTELAGLVNEHLVNVKIPDGFPAQAPEIQVDGRLTGYTYRNDQTVVDCIDHAIRSAENPGSSFSGNNRPDDPLFSEDRFMDDVQAILLRHPEIQPVGGNLRQLHGRILSTFGTVAITVSFPSGYPSEPAQLILDRDLGFGISIPHTTLNQSLSQAIDVIISKANAPVYYSPPPAQPSAQRYVPERKPEYRQPARPYPSQQHYPSQSTVPPVEREQPAPIYTSTRAPGTFSEKAPDLPPDTLLWGLFGAGLLLIAISFFADVFIILLLVIVASTVAAYADASNIMSPKVTFGPGRVAISVLILWLICFPYYILTRKTYYEERLKEINR